MEIENVSKSTKQPKATNGSSAQRGENPAHRCRLLLARTQKCLQEKLKLEKMSWPKNKNDENIKQETFS